MKIIIFYLSIIFLLIGCEGKNVKKIKYLVVENNLVNETLNFTGTIEPVINGVVTAPVDGVITERIFNYGNYVNSNKALFTMRSDKFIADYKSSLLNYIKAKNDLDNSKSLLSESVFLHKHKLISDDDLKSKKNSFYVNNLAYIQAKDSIIYLMQQINMQKIDLENLTIQNIDLLTKTLNPVDINDLIKIKSLKKGIVLAAKKSESEIKKINSGDVVKQGDVLAVIGKNNAFQVFIKIDEFTINKLTNNYTAKVSGLAFPEIVLNGKILNIDKQADDNSSGMPRFLVQVLVENIPDNYFKKIQMGMTANISLSFNKDSSISIPITALHSDNGKGYVEVVNGATVSKKYVGTGIATLDNVEVTQGLQVGDKIIVSN